MTPSFTSGWPNFALSLAILIAHAIASSHPPPRAKPLTAAMTGLPRFSIRSVNACPRRVASSASTAVLFAISAMSAPAANAFSPAPVRMTPRTVESSRESSKAARNSWIVTLFSAFRTLGLFSVTYAIGPFLSYKTFSSFRAEASELISFSLLIADLRRSYLGTLYLGVHDACQVPFRPKQGLLVRAVKIRAVDRSTQVGQKHAAAFQIQGDSDSFHQMVENYHRLS